MEAKMLDEPLKQKARLKLQHISLAISAAAAASVRCIVFAVTILAIPTAVVIVFLLECHCRHSRKMDDSTTTTTFSQRSSNTFRLSNYVTAVLYFCILWVCKNICVYAIGLFVPNTCIHHVFHTPAHGTSASVAASALFLFPPSSAGQVSPLHMNSLGKLLFALVIVCWCLTGCWTWGRLLLNFS